MADPFHVEIPAFYLDALVLEETPAQLVLVNRDPEPDEVGVAPDGVITLQLIDTVEATIQLEFARVYINGELAFENGSFEPAFSGPHSIVSQPSTDTLQVAIDPVDVWSSEQVVTVRVHAQINGQPSLFVDTTYSFVVADVVAPAVLSAKAKSTTEIEIAFDEAMRMQGDNETADALTSSCYLLTPLSVPAVPVSVVSVTKVDDERVLLQTNIDLSPGARYRVTVVDAEDSDGNAIGAPYHQTDFEAFRLPRPAARRFSVWEFMPSAARQADESGELRLFAACFQESLDFLLWDLDKYCDILDPDVAPDWMLDQMLYDLGNPFSFVLDETEKRRLIRVLVPLYKRKGTAVGLVEAIRFFLGLEATVTDPGGTGIQLGISYLGVDWILGSSAQALKYTFDLEFGVVLTEEQRARVVAITRYMKPAHTHLGAIHEPEPPVAIDHLELGLSQLGLNWLLH